MGGQELAGGLGHRLRRDRTHLEGWLHHPCHLFGPHQGSLRPQRAAPQPASGQGLRPGACGAPACVASHPSPTSTPTAESLCLLISCRRNAIISAATPTSAMTARQAISTPSGPMPILLTPLPLADTKIRTAEKQAPS